MVITVTTPGEKNAGTEEIGVIHAAYHKTMKVFGSYAGHNPVH